MTKPGDSHHVDFVVVGCGVAGLRAAIELGQAGRVLILAKSELNESATAWAQGGVATALSDEDEINLHEKDTLQAGDGLCNPEAVNVLVGEGPQYIQQLIEWGTQFDRAGTRLAFTREGACSGSRVLHAQNDSNTCTIDFALRPGPRRKPRQPLPLRFPLPQRRRVHKAFADCPRQESLLRTASQPGSLEADFYLLV